MKQEEWQEWHEMVKKKIKIWFPNTELEKPYDFGKEMEWGRLENYRVDASLRIDGRLVIFEVETYFNQDKIIRFIMASSYIGADLLVVIFSNQQDEWDGKTRAKATEYLAKILNSIMVRPVNVVAIFGNTDSDIESGRGNLRLD